MAVEQKKPDLKLLTKTGCHLCQDARQVLDRVTAECSLDYRELDIDQDPLLQARYKNEIPVVLLEDRVVDFWQINPKRLRKVLLAWQHKNREAGNV
ncbi:MAG: glutaredoxin family protein [Rothia sp. (in: high G+C Gram-positive bacteria)]|nr:glutaredoxin family protein [Rothia sp. (in: high G+C Gram-positive bacteria)]